MPTKKPASPTPPASSTAKAAGRKPGSAPAHPDAPGGDALAQRNADVQELASAMPYNANKRLEHGHTNAIAPVAGASVPAPPRARPPAAP